MRNTDIDLLHHLKVNVICDFMVEKKKVKFGMNVTSSEKVDRQQRYSDFGLICIPYPGCEFFADYKHNNYTGIGLKFDWSQQFVDAILQVPEKVHNVPGVQWNNYVDWDLVKLTQNYLKLLLNCITKPCSSGMLLHCISGWDRTPLFVSLLRLSLWADGIIHQSLNADDIVYLTLAYDWLLFSHQFVDRIEKSEEIMHFCFYFLKYISSVDFSLLPHLNNTDLFTSENGNSVEDMFDFEQSDAENQNILNGISLNNSYLNDHLSQNTDMQEIQECLHNLVDQASKSDCLHCDNVLNNDNLSLENESTTITCNENSHLTPATLPLIYTSTHQLNGLTHTNEPDNVFDKNYILATTPNSALSTSFNKAKNNLNAFESDHDLISNSFPTANKRVSEPIFVPNGKVSSQSLDCLLDKVSNVGSSSNTGNAEPGSSWQLISPLAAPQEQTRMNTSPESSRKSSTVSSITSETSVFKSKLLRRKERLESATNVMIPAYCAAVQKRRQEQEQASTLSTMFGNIAHFIKRA